MGAMEPEAIELGLMFQEAASMVKKELEDTLLRNIIEGIRKQFEENPDMKPNPNRSDGSLAARNKETHRLTACLEHLDRLAAGPKKDAIMFQEAVSKLKTGLDNLRQTIMYQIREIEVKAIMKNIKQQFEQHEDTKENCSIDENSLVGCKEKKQYLTACLERLAQMAKENDTIVFLDAVDRYKSNLEYGLYKIKYALPALEEKEIDRSGFKIGDRIQCLYSPQRKDKKADHAGWYSATVRNIEPHHTDRQQNWIPIEIEWDSHPGKFFWRSLKKVRKHPDFKSGNSVILCGFGGFKKHWVLNGVKGTLGSKRDDNGVTKWKISFQHVRIPGTNQEYSEIECAEKHFGSPP